MPKGNWSVPGIRNVGTGLSRRDWQDVKMLILCYNIYKYESKHKSIRGHEYAHVVAVQGVCEKRSEIV